MSPPPMTCGPHAWRVIHSPVRTPASPPAIVHAIGGDLAQARSAPGADGGGPSRRPRGRASPRSGCDPSDLVHGRRDLLIARACRSLLGLLHLQFDVDAGREVEALQGLDRLARRFDDVDQALVDAHLEVLAAVLVDVR